MKNGVVVSNHAFIFFFLLEFGELQWIACTRPLASLFSGGAGVFFWSNWMIPYAQLAGLEWALFFSTLFPLGSSCVCRWSVLLRSHRFPANCAIALDVPLLPHHFVEYVWEEDSRHWRSRSSFGPPRFNCCQGAPPRFPLNVHTESHVSTWFDV